MSKNLTRKGLALGVVVALGTSVFAGPAFAADTLSTAVSAGTSYTTVVGNANALQLTTLMSPGLEAAEATLKYRILNPTGAALYIKVGNTTTAVAEIASAGTATANVYKYSDNSALDTAAGVITSTDFVVALEGASAGESTEANLIQVASTTAGATVTVQAWMDTSAGASNKLDSVEDAAPARAITFVAAADIAWTTTLATPLAGATDLTATVSALPEINGNYLATTPTVKFTRQGSSAAIESAVTTWSNTNNNFATGTAVNLAANNWIGMPNNVQMSNQVVAGGTDATPAAAATSTVTTVTVSGLVIGDVVDVVSSSNKVTKAAATVTAVDDDAKTVAYLAPGAAGAAQNLTSAAVTPSETAGFVRVLSKKLAKSSASLTAATYTTLGEHKLATGDFVIIDSAVGGVFDRATRVAVASVPTAKTFTVSLAVAGSAVVAEATDAGSVTYDSFDEVVPGTYSAQAWLGGAKIGSASSNANIAAEAATVRISTTGSATLHGVSKVGTVGTIEAKTGVLTADVLATVLDADGAAIGAGHAVKVTVLTVQNSVKVNGFTAAGQVLITDANGQVKLTITSPSGIDSDSAAVTLVAENVATATASFTLAWNPAVVGLVDLSTTDAALTNSTRTIVAGGTYDLNVAVADQFFTAADSAAYRLKVTGAGVTQSAVALTAGKAIITITDNKLSATSFATILRLQKLVGTSWVDQNADITITNNIAPSSVAVNLGAAASTIYGDEVVTTSKVAAVATSELDQRQVLKDAPLYLNNAVLNGQVVNKGTAAALAGAVVKISGPSNVLFQNGNVYKAGSLTALADASGKFQFKAFSTSAQTDSVITITALGVSSTVKVTFTGIGVGEGTALAVTAPATALPASTFQISAKLSDTYGNGVTAAAGRVKVTHVGPGIVYGTLPTSTDANGALSFAVLLGAADAGNAVFTVSYDQNGDGDFVDAKDLTSAKTVVIGAASVLNMSASVAGIKGFVATTVRNASGKAVTVTVNGRVLTPRAPNAAAQLYRFRATAGKTTVVVKVDGVTVASRTVTVK